jgi:hypothetical protein
MSMVESSRDSGISATRAYNQGATLPREPGGVWRLVEMPVNLATFDSIAIARL